MKKLNRICPICNNNQGTIIIASALYSSEIISEIKSDGLKNKTIVLGQK